MLCSVVIFGLVPLAHFCSFASRAELALFLPGLLGMFACYGLGLYFFLSRVPERWTPGRFDLFGSHAIWHGFTFAAMLSWDASLQQALDGRDWECEAFAPSPVSGIAVATT